MSRFSLRSLIGILTFSAIVLWLAYVPRGRINRSTARQLKSGMTIDDASRIIGLAPGWYDGIYGTTGATDGNRFQNRIEWVNLNGGIVVDVHNDGKIYRASFVTSSEISASYYVSEMLYDRSIRRFVDSDSPIATLAGLLLLSVLSATPSLIVARIFAFKITDFICVGIAVGLSTYFILAACVDMLWIRYDNCEFTLVMSAVAVASFSSTGLLAFMRAGIRKRQSVTTMVGEQCDEPKSR